MARQSDNERNRKQRDRQRRRRAQHRAERRPDRDDVARVLLHWSIVGQLDAGRHGMLEALGDVLVAKLVAQGFDERASYEVFDGLVEKYGDAHWGFRRKPHLRSSASPAGSG